MSKTEPKKYTEEDMKATWIKGKIQGRKEAEEYLQARINQISITNRQLLLEIMRLDKIEPVNGICLTYRYAEKLVRVLRKKKMRGYANHLKSIINKSNQIDMGQLNR